MHPKVDTPMCGPDAPWQMATRTTGDLAGETVCILVEFSDGKRIVDPGEQGPLDVVDIHDLRLWREVKSVSFVGGVVKCEPVEG